MIARMSKRVSAHLDSRSAKWEGDKWFTLMWPITSSSGLSMALMSGCHALLFAIASALALTSASTLASQVTGIRTVRPKMPKLLVTRCRVL